MPRNMSFSITTEQYRNRTKTVTRRLGWWFLKHGDILNGVEKGMGLKKGEKLVKFGQHKIIFTRPEPLNAVTQEEVILEGFPDMTPTEFIDMFCRSHKGCRPETMVNRIEFEYL